jgi:hypothetical protein
MKTPFVTSSQLDKITTEYPTPFHLYDEKGIRKKHVQSIKLSVGTLVLRNTLQLKQHRHQLS